MNRLATIELSLVLCLAYCRWAPSLIAVVFFYTNSRLAVVHAGTGAMRRREDRDASCCDLRIQIKGYAA